MWTIEDVKARCEIKGDHWIWKLYCDPKGHPKAYTEGRSDHNGTKIGKHRSVRQFVFLKCMEQVAGEYIEPKGAQYLADCGVDRCVSPNCVRPKTCEEKARAKNPGKVIRMKADQFDDGWKAKIPKNWKPNYSSASVFTWGQSHG